MTRKPAPAWPPIITDARVPRVVVWRDRIMTVAMWLLLLYLARRGLYVVWDETLELLGRAQLAPEPNWARWWERLRLYVAAAAVLGLWLLGWGMVALRRVRRAAGKPQPPVLSLAEEARHARCTEADLATWRTWRVARVHLDENGAISVVPGGPPPDSAPAARP